MNKCYMHAITWVDLKIITLSLKKKKARRKQYKHYDAAYVKFQENANQSTVTESTSVIAWREAELGGRDGSQRGMKKLWG